MEKLLSDITIHQITWDTPTTSFTFRVGQSVPIGDSRVEISKIIRDENNYHYFGTIIYIIYAKNSGDEEYIWRYVENQPVSIVCKVPESQKQ